MLGNPKAAEGVGDCLSTQNIIRRSEKILDNSKRFWHHQNGKEVKLRFSNSYLGNLESFWRYLYAKF